MPGLRLRLLHAREIHQIVCQLREPPGLLLNVQQPLVVLAELGFEHLGVGMDDRKRRFDLVPRVGDEALLLFVALGDRTDDPP